MRDLKNREDRLFLKDLQFIERKIKIKRQEDNNYSVLQVNNS